MAHVRVGMGHRKGAPWGSRHSGFAGVATLSLPTTRQSRVTPAAAWTPASGARQGRPPRKMVLTEQPGLPDKGHGVSP